MYLPFAKICDGNRDFVIMNGTGRRVDWRAVAMRMCRRRAGIGASALLVTCRTGRTGFRFDAYGVTGRARPTDDCAARCAALALREDYGVRELLLHTPQGVRQVRLELCPPKVGVAHRSLWTWGDPELICTGEVRWSPANARLCDRWDPVG